VNAIEVAQNIKQSVPLIINYSSLISVYSVKDNSFDFLEHCLLCVKCVLLSLLRDIN
jgi:hypothetical protein